MGFSLKGAISGALGGGISGLATGNPLGVLAGAGLGAVSGGLETSSANQAAKQQRQWAIDDWNAQNAYNSPVEQMKRLKAAGLNPMLVYGSGNVTGNASSAISQTNVGSSYPQGATNSLLNAFSKLDLKQKKEDTKGSELQNEYLQLRNDLLRLQVANFGIGSGTGNSTNSDLQRRKLELQVQQLLDKSQDLGGGSIWNMNTWKSIGSAYMGGIYDIVGAGLNKAFGKRSGGIFD